MTKVNDKKKEKTTKKEKEIEKKIEKEVERLIYCGPNIGFKATTDTTYIGGIPKMLSEEIKSCSDIEKLFVPIENYVETKKKLQEEGTIENLAYRAIQAFIRDKRGESNEL